MKFVRIAKRAALKGSFRNKRNQLRFRTGAVLAKGGSVVSVGWNENRYCSYSSRFREHLEGTMHAEVRAILNKPRHITEGCDIYVVRLSSDGKDLRMAKPCAMCEEVLRRAGIRRVFYSNNESEIEVLNLGVA